MSRTSAGRFDRTLAARAIRLATMNYNRQRCSILRSDYETESVAALRTDLVLSDALTHGGGPAASNSPQSIAKQCDAFRLRNGIRIRIVPWFFIPERNPRAETYDPEIRRNALHGNGIHSDYETQFGSGIVAKFVIREPAPDSRKRRAGDSPQLIAIPCDAIRLRNGIRIRIAPSSVIQERIPRAGTDDLNIRRKALQSNAMHSVCETEFGSGFRLFETGSIRRIARRLIHGNMDGENGIDERVGSDSMTKGNDG